MTLLIKLATGLCFRLIYMHCKECPHGMMVLEQRFSTFSNSWTTWQILSWFETEF